LRRLSENTPSPSRTKTTARLRGSQSPKHNGTAAPSPIVSETKPLPEFSYRTRMAAFIVYFASFILIGYLLSPILHGLSPFYERWSNQALLRLSERVLTKQPAAREEEEDG